VAAPRPADRPAERESATRDSSTEQETLTDATGAPPIENIAEAGGTGTQAPAPGGTEARPEPPQPIRTEEEDTAAVELAAEVLAMQRAVAAEPNRADLHRKLGFLLARQGKTSEAAEEFRKALQVSRMTL
jgi:Flp pilus assembly protein TadD